MAVREGERRREREAGEKRGQEGGRWKGEFFFKTELFALFV